MCVLSDTKRFFDINSLWMQTWFYSLFRILWHSFFMIFLFVCSMAVWAESQISALPTQLRTASTFTCITRCAPDIKCWRRHQKDPHNNQTDELFTFKMKHNCSRFCSTLQAECGTEQETEILVMSFKPKMGRGFRAGLQGRQHTRYFRKFYSKPEVWIVIKKNRA